jgi:LAGLIDADG endonuclease
MTVLLLNPDWVAGFCAGEMSFSFYVSKYQNKSRKSRFRLCFSLAQHSKELNLIQALHNFFNCGLVCLDGSASRKIVYFRVNSLKDAKQLCSFFEKS